MSIDKTLFAGCEIDAVLGRALSQNPTWLSSENSKLECGSPLKRVQFSGKEYLGCYFPEEKVQLCQIEKVESKLSQLISTLCPDKKHHVILFTQLLVS